MPPENLSSSGCANRLSARSASGFSGAFFFARDVTFSNSLIEAWWRTLKHQWLYLNTLDTLSRLDKLIAFYVDEHNTRLPHSAFRGQTPDEMYFGTGKHIPQELETGRKDARQSRMEVNRNTSCPTCELLTVISS